jgi:hypothetical protein
MIYLWKIFIEWALEYPKAAQTVDIITANILFYAAIVYLIKHILPWSKDTRDE